MLDKINSLKQKDSILGKLIEENELETLRWHDNVFEDLASCLLDSQIRYRGKAEKYNSFKTALNIKKIDSVTILNLSVSDFRNYNLDRQELILLLNLSKHWELEHLNEINWHALSDSEVRSKLMKISGITDWMVDMILLYSLQRPDIFPLDDLQLIRTIRRIYNITDKKSLKSSLNQLSNLWAPYRSTAVIYLFNIDSK